MKLILNGINGEYLRSVIQLAVGETDRVDAAVAYANEAALLFDWCWEHRIVLRYWGRYDDSIPVSVPILKSFLDRRSPNFTCKLIRKFHPKVIWWRGYGAYIGSANLGNAAWYSNVEAGVFLTDAELNAAGHDLELEEFFGLIDDHASPLTDELFQVIEQRARVLQTIRNQDRAQREAFETLPFVQAWEGLATVSVHSASERRRGEFLKEWNSTLQILRNLAVIVSKDENRPAWVGANTPGGAQADQFLHAHYYQRTFDGQFARFEEHYQRNRSDPESAVRRAIEWWRNLSEPPGSELITLDEWGPFLRERLAKSRVLQMTEADLIEVCLRVHSIRDHARRVSNVELGLVPNQRYSIEEKSESLGRYLWSRRSGNGETFTQLVHWVLYGGPRRELPERLWDAVSDPNRRIEHVGVSGLGELVGWALPDEFPPRNGRTSKSLRSLGYDVAVHA